MIVYTKSGGSSAALLITGRNSKDLSPEKFTAYCFSTKISVSLYQKGWQLSCHLITGRNVMDLFPHIVLVRK